MDVATIKRKQWAILNDNILSRDRKTVAPRKDNYSVLRQAHCAIAHRGRDKTEAFVKQSHAEIIITTCHYIICESLQSLPTAKECHRSLKKTSIKANTGK